MLEILVLAFIVAAIIRLAMRLEIGFRRIERRIDEVNPDQEVVDALADRLDAAGDRLQNAQDEAMDPRAPMRAQTRRYQMADLSVLTEKVTLIEGVVASGVALIQALAQEIRDNSTDPTALQALADRLDAASTSMAEAIAANPDPTP